MFRTITRTVRVIYQYYCALVRIDRPIEICRAGTKLILWRMARRPRQVISWDERPPPLGLVANNQSLEFEFYYCGLSTIRNQFYLKRGLCPLSIVYFIVMLRNSRV